MRPFTTVTARLGVIDRANIDTDQIIPARFLREPRGDGYGGFLFHDAPELQAAVEGAGVLRAGENFGCGSSREGAVYALVDAGVRCVIAPSFGDIFAGNAGKNGLLLLALPAAVTAGLAGEVTIDLVAQCLRAAGVTAGCVTAGGVTAGEVVLRFEVEPYRRRMLLEGLDDIGLTLAHGADLDAWAARDAVARPWVGMGASR